MYQEWLICVQFFSKARGVKVLSSGGRVWPRSGDDRRARNNSWEVTVGTQQICKFSSAQNLCSGVQESIAFKSSSLPSVSQWAIELHLVTFKIHRLLLLWIGNGVYFMKSENIGIFPCPFEFITNKVGRLRKLICDLRTSSADFFKRAAEKTMSMFETSCCSSPGPESSKKVLAVF